MKMVFFIDWLEHGTAKYKYSEDLELILLPFNKKDNKEVIYDFENLLCYNLDEMLKEGKNITTELHTTLAAVLDDLKDYENIFQCHRSFVVNLNNISSAQGNSNGYQLKLGKCPTIVPVSRTYVPKLRSFIA